MKKGWQIKKLGEVCTVDWGNTDLTKSAYVEGGKFLAVSAAGCDGRIGHKEHEKYTPVLSAIGAQCGRMFLPEEDFTAIKNTITLTPRDGICTGKFLYQLLTHVELPKRGAAQPFISKGDIQSFQVPVPPLAEQRRLVAILDEAFAGLATAKANAEKNLQNARALFESHLQSVFTQRGPGWVEKPLESCCKQIFAGGDVPKDRLSQERTSKFSVPIYSNGEKNDGLYGFTDVARVTVPSITVSARGTLGFTAIRTEPFLPVVRLIVLVPDEKQIVLSFLYYAVVGMDFGNTGTSIPQLTVPNFKESKLHVPSLLEQESIVAKLDALSAETRRLAAVYSRRLAALEALKKSLLHAAFSGGL